VGAYNGSVAEVKLCEKKGWIYEDYSSDGTQRYIFASPLHERYVQWMLFGTPPAQVVEDNIFSFALAVIRKFSPLNLTLPRWHRSSIQPVPEAQFQDEFYRACCRHTKNCVVSFPEFGTQKGWIDFFLPTKKWVVELVRNSDHLFGHGERFTKGEYRNWICSGVMMDYIILDFCAQLPEKDFSSKPSLLIIYDVIKICSPEIKNLYHVVHQANWMSVEVYDNKKERITGFSLTYH
jgi:hypothetical protein